MVRKCIIEGCEHSDQTILAHRFPQKRTLLELWRDNLELSPKQYSDFDLLKKYVVCSLHFKKTDYRNPISSFLNTTAVPYLHVAPAERKNMCEDYYQPNTNLIHCSSKPVEIFKIQEDEIYDNQTANLDTQEEEIIELITIEHDTLGDPTMIKYGEYSYPLMEVEQKEEREKIVTRYDKIHKNNLRRLKPTIKKSEPKSTRKIVKNSAIQPTDTIMCEGIGKKPVYIEEFKTINSDIAQKLNLRTIENSTQTDPAVTRPVIDTINREETEILDKYSEFSGKTKIELIREVIKAKSKLIELEEKLESFQASHARMVQSMEVFKSLIN